jgi:RimJ/RimL family protein N-acetyltransferase
MVELIKLQKLKREEKEKIYNIRYSNFVHHNFGGSVPTLEEHFEWIENLKDRNDRIGFAIKENKELVGGCNLKAISWENECAEFDIYIGEEFISKGIGKKALQKLLNHGFFDLKLKRIYAYLLANNYKALETYYKIGFKKESTIKKNVRKGDQLYDSYLINLNVNDFSINYEDCN